MAHTAQQAVTIITGHGLKPGETIRVSSNGQVIGMVADVPGGSTVLAPVFTVEIVSDQAAWNAIQALVEAQNQGQQTAQGQQYRSQRSGSSGNQ